MGLPVCADFNTMVNSFNKHAHKKYVLSMSHVITLITLQHVWMLSCSWLNAIDNSFPSSKRKKEKDKSYHVGRMETMLIIHGCKIFWGHAFRCLSISFLCILIMLCTIAKGLTL